MRNSFHTHLHTQLAAVSVTRSGMRSAGRDRGTVTTNDADETDVAQGQAQHAAACLGRSSPQSRLGLPNHVPPIFPAPRLSSPHTKLPLSNARDDLTRD